MKLNLFSKLLITTALVMGANAAWADNVVLPTPVYFNDFSFAVSGQDGIEIVGNGQFENDSDPRFGKIFHNDPGTTPVKAFRTNYLKLPTTLLSSSGASTSKQLTIGVWVNKKSATDFYNSPLFTAYSAAPTGEGNKSNTWPMLALETRGVLFSNNYGIFDSTNEDNVEGTNSPSTAWLDDGNWHYYTCVITETTCIFYQDGIIINSYSVDNQTDGHNLAHIFGTGGEPATTNLSKLTYVCLGGNQAWDWSGTLDIDPAFGFDDFAVYNVALSKEQIDQIRTNKLNRTVTGTQIGNKDNSTEYMAALSTKMTLKPGDSYHYSFINYNNGSANANNCVIPVYDASDNNVIVVRMDNWEDKGWNNKGCTSNFNGDNFPGELNGATVDMTVTFTAEKVFNMTSTITTVSGLTWNYSYTNDYDESTISLTSNDYIKVALSVSRSWIDLLTVGYSAVAATLGNNGYTTFANASILDLANLPSGLTAYKAQINGSTVNFSPVTVAVPANTGILLGGTANETYSIPVAESANALADNDFHVNTAGTTFAAEENTKYYGMVKDSNPLKFGWFNPATVAIPSNKAYLKVTSTTPAPELFVSFGDVVTSMKGVETVTSTKGAYFNLAGQRVAQPTKGLYIVNGKKYIVK